jgi:ferredoxin
MAAVGTEETVDFGPAVKILQEMGETAPGELIPLLQRIQDAYGYLPREVLVEVGLLSGIACHIRGVGENRRTAERLLSVMDDQTCMVDMARYFLTFVQKECCGGCVKVCTSNAIEGKKKEPHKILTEDCIRCGACLAICPRSAVYKESHGLRPHEPMTCRGA